MAVVAEFRAGSQTSLLGRNAYCVRIQRKSGQKNVNTCSITGSGTPHQDYPEIRPPQN